MVLIQVYHQSPKAQIRKSNKSKKILIMILINLQLLEEEVLE